MVAGHCSLLRTQYSELCQLLCQGKDAITAVVHTMADKGWKDHHTFDKCRRDHHTAKGWKDHHTLDKSRRDHHTAKGWKDHHRADKGPPHS